MRNQRNVKTTSRSILPIKILLSVAAILSAAIAPSPTFAQSSILKQDSGVKVAIPTELTQEPYEIPSLGMSVYLPSSSLVDLSRLEGGRTTVAVRPELESGQWMIQIQSSISSDTDLTLKTALANIIGQRQGERKGVDKGGRERSLVRVFDREDDLLAGSLPAARVYLDVPVDPSAWVTGYTLFRQGPGQFVILQLDCSPAVFPRIRSLYELMAATVEFRDPDELGADRAAALLAGEALASKFSQLDWSTMHDDQPTFYRLYRPAPSGSPTDAEEVGYQRVHVRAGTADELSGTKRPAANRADSDTGTIVRIDARALTLGAVVDTISMFFQSDDRESELWSVTMVVRRGREREQWTETGIRRGKRLTVSTNQTGEAPTSVDYSVPEGYFSRVETYLLPRLAAESGTGGLFGFYCYEGGLGKMTLRREELAQESPELWVQKTQLSENSRPIVTTLGPRGQVIRRVTPDGQVMEPVEQDRLRRIWTDKKLPLE